MKKDEKIELIAKRMEEILHTLGLDLTDPSMAKTPQRIAKMYVEEIFSELHSPFPSLSFIEHEGEKNMVFVKTSFISFCEHHFVPFQGHVSIAFVPNKKLIGLSHLPRIVKHFAKRPQIQERLTKQIADSIENALETTDVAVSINAVHFCVIARGQEDHSSMTLTNILRGQFNENESLRSQFFEAIRG